MRDAFKSWGCEDQDRPVEQIGPEREWGSGDADQPYRYVRPSYRCPYPFSMQTYARLLALRSRVRSGEVSELSPAA